MNAQANIKATKRFATYTHTYAKMKNELFTYMHKQKLRQQSALPHTYSRKNEGSKELFHIHTQARK